MRKELWTKMLAALLAACLMLGAASAEMIYPKLKRGDESSAVREMQTSLQALGFDVKPDGVFGYGTRTAVKQFQQIVGLEVDGVAGHETLKKLYELAPNGVAINGKIYQEQAAATQAPVVYVTPAPQTQTQPASGGYIKLKRGDEGDLVRAMQNALVKLGYLSKADGVYGDGTRSAVKRFQQAQGLEVDGIAGQDTQARLFAAAAGVTQAPIITQAPVVTATPVPVVTAIPAPVVTETPAPSSYIKLKRGDEGDLVRAMQNALVKLGYLSKADGVYGDGTRSAVKRFQQAQGLEVDGIAGQDTQARLFAAAAGAAQAPVVTATPSATASLTPATVMTGGGKLNLRDAGKSGSRVIATIPNGTSLLLSAKGETWCETTYNGVFGYVQTQYLYFPPVVAVTPTPVPAVETTVTPISVSGKLDRVMYSGETGDDVYYVQQRLAAYQYACALTKVYDAQTIEAVRNFQIRNGLKVDGFMGPSSFSLLVSGRAIAFTNSYPTLRLGNTGDQVTAMQTALKQLGYDCDATGSFDDKTKLAVLAFQRANALSTDGIAGQQTLSTLYSGSASAPGEESGKGDGGVRISGPSSSSVQLLHWFNEVKPSLSDGSRLLVYDPGTGYGWTLKVYSRGNHCDSEPLTAADTASMNAAMGAASWTPHAVYVKLPDGRWSLATMHNVPHLSGGIAANDFNGHLCVHFLRDMSECKLHDPNYGVQHQNAIRKAWKAMTGEVVE